MKRMIGLLSLAVLTQAGCLMVGNSVSVPLPGESYAEVTNDGAWCWFSEPRAIQMNGKTYTGWVKKDGSIEMGELDGSSNPAKTFMLHSKLQYDDHNNPAFLTMPDGRLAGFYNTHGNDDLFLRITENAGDISAWTPFRRLGMRDKAKGGWGMTYVNPVRLTDENNKIFLFFRGSDYKPNLSTSTDLGQTWSKPVTVVSRTGKADSNRPYGRYWDDGKGRIDMIFTDGHPRNEKTNRVFFMRYDDGAFRKADGTKIATLDQLPLHPDKADVVYDASQGRGWIWDVCDGKDGNPVIVYTRLPGDTKETIGRDHRYHYARWDGKKWVDHEIAKAGGWFPHTVTGKVESEPHYSAGISLDKNNPNIVYYAAPVNGKFEIFRAETADGGATWKKTAVTQNSVNDNVRPITVRHADDSSPRVMWMNLRSYPHFVKFDCSIRMDRPAPASK